MKKYLANFLKMIGTLAFLYIIFVMVDFNSLFLNLASVKISHLLYGFLIFFVMQLVSTYRWYLLLITHKLNLKYSYLFYANAVSMLSGLIVPTNFGTDAVRFFYAAKKKGIDKKKATVGTIGDRVFGMFSMGLMFFFAIIISDYTTYTQKRILAAIGFIGFVFFGYIFFKRRKVMKKFGKLIIKLPFGKLINSIFDDISVYKNNELIRLFFISLVINFIGVYYTYILLLAAGAEVPFILVFIANPIKRLITLLPISFGGIGVNEVAMWTLLSVAGVTMDQIIAYSAITYIILIISCIFYMLPGLFNKKELN